LSTTFDVNVKLRSTLWSGRVGRFEKMFAECDDIFSCKMCHTRVLWSCKRAILTLINDQRLKQFIICRKFDIMHIYADNLEKMVQQRTAELVDEKKKTDMLLHRMLPT